MRPILRPGLHLLRRDVRTLQIGLEWPAIAALPDSPIVQAALRAVDGCRTLEEVVDAAALDAGVERRDAQAAVDILVACGALVDQALIPPAGVDPALWAAWWLLVGPRRAPGSIAARRRRTPTFVVGSGRVADRIRGLLLEERVPLVSATSSAALVVLACDGEPDRERAEDELRRGVPCLCVGLRELVAVVGPFVVPGRTACLHCLDRARMARDRCWPTLVASASVRPPTVRAVPPALLAVVAGYAAQEAALWASGSLPATCDAVLEIPYGLGGVEIVHCRPHPDCGCVLTAEQGTMTA